MDKKSKILMWVFIFSVCISVGITYYRYVIKKDYIIFVHVECNPEVDSCFYYECEEGDSECEIEYYKKIEKKAFNIELCDSESPDCKPLFCAEGEKDCTITNCSVDNVEEGEKCSVPVSKNPTE